jgi:glycerophosphoryl diester phosphodiesterase
MTKTKKNNYWGSLLCVIFLFFLSCEDKEQELPTGSGSVIIHTPIQYDSLTNKSMYALEGIYKVVSGSNVFGDTLVVKQTVDKISFFGNNNGCYVNLIPGSNDSIIKLEGYWRNSSNFNAGRVLMFINDAEDLIQGDTTLANIIISGKYSNGQSAPNIPIQLQLIEKFTARLRSDQFIIGAHRGGATTSDKLPFTENTLEMINFTKYLGSTGIEIDVSLTRDNIPVLYHDYLLNIRLVQNSLLAGRIKDYTFSQLRSSVKLIHGESIPSLEEAFEAVLNNTNIKTVWLDIKDADAINYAIPLQLKYINLAKKAGRNLEILIGIPADDVYNAFTAYPDYQNIPSLCELSTNQVTSINAKAWAPRWTDNIQEQEITSMHSQGRKCMIWTVDTPESIELYASQGGPDANKRFDEILTNYPTVLAYYHYVRHNF